MYVIQHREHRVYFQCEIKNKYVTGFIYEREFIKKNAFIYSVGATPGEKGTYNNLVCH